MSALEYNYKILRSWFIRSLQQSAQDEYITQVQCDTLIKFVDSCDDIALLSLIVAGSSTFALVELQIA